MQQDALNIQEERVTVSRVWVGREPLPVLTPRGIVAVRVVWDVKKRRRKYEILSGGTLEQFAYLISALNRYLLTGRK